MSNPDDTSKQVREQVELTSKLIFEPHSRDESVPEITHSEFLTGLKDGTVAYHILDSTFVIRGVRKKIFAGLVMLYAIAPLIFVPLFTFFWQSWIYLLGLVASYIGTFVIARRRIKSLEAILFVSTIVSWWTEGFHSVPTFLLLCVLWGELTYHMANGAEADYGLQALTESAELYDQAITYSKINVWRWRDMANTVSATMKPKETE